MREEIIKKTDAFIRRELMKLADYQDNVLRMAEYRIEHSYRVAHIAAQIAELEGFDQERAFVAGMLHDIGYSIDYTSKEDYKNHGRYGATIARPFLMELGYNREETEEICYGIAIHVDDVADFPGERTPLALTVGDADNIDRFDAFRLFEGLQDADYRNMPLQEQRAFVEKKLSRLQKLREMPCGTPTGESLWQEKVDYQIEFYHRLKHQIDTSA